MWLKTEGVFPLQTYGLIFLSLTLCLFAGWVSAHAPSSFLTLTLGIGFLFLTLLSSYWAFMLLFAMIPISWGLPGIQIGIINLKWCYLMGAILSVKILWLKAISVSKVGLGKEWSLPLSLFLICAFFSALVSVDPWWSLKEFAQLGYYVLLLWIVVHLMNNESLVMRATKDWFVLTVILSATGLLGWLLGGGAYDLSVGTRRLLVGFGDPNGTANFLLAGIALGITLGFNPNLSLAKKALFRGGTLLLWTALILTFSRAGWMVGAALTIFLLIFAKGRSASRFGFILILLMLFLIVLILHPSSLLNRMSSIGSLGDSSNIGHLHLWYLAIQSILHHPLLGVGTGAFPVYFRLIDLGGWVSVGSGSTYLSSTVGYFGGAAAHNAFLQLWAEIGTIGFLLFVFVLLKLLKKAYLSFKFAEDSSFKTNRLGIFCALVAISVHNLSITGIIDYYWIMMGLLMAYVRLAEQKGA